MCMITSRFKHCMSQPAKEYGCFEKDSCAASSMIMQVAAYRRGQILVTSASPPSSSSKRKMPGAARSCSASSLLLARSYSPPCRDARMRRTSATMIKIPPNVSTPARKGRAAALQLKFATIVVLVAPGVFTESRFKEARALPTRAAADVLLSG